MPLKRKLTFLIVAIALAASAAGAYAATQSAAPSSRQAFLNDVARRLHVTPLQLKNALKGAYADRVAALVASGRLTKAQAKAIEQRLGNAPGAPGLGLFGPARALRGMRIHPGVARGWYAYPPGRSFRRGGPRPPDAALPPGVPVPPGAAVRPGAFGLAFGPGLLPAGIKAASSYLGISLSKLQSDLRSGKSLAKIASAQGKTASGLESAIDSAVKARIDTGVGNKRLTRAQAQKVLSALDAQVAAIVTGTAPRVQWGVLRPHMLRQFRMPRAFPRRPGARPRGAAARLPGALFQPA